MPFSCLILRQFHRESAVWTGKAPSRRQRALKNQRFRKGVGGRGLATNSAQNAAENVPQNCVFLLIRGHRQKGAAKRLESMAREGFPCTNPLCPPTPFRDLRKNAILRCPGLRCSGYGTPPKMGVRQRSGEGVVRRDGLSKRVFLESPFLLCPLRVCSCVLRANPKGAEEKRTLQNHPFGKPVSPHDAFSAPLARSEINA